MDERRSKSDDLLLTEDDSQDGSFTDEGVTGGDSIAGRENRLVEYSKVLVLTVIAIVAVIMGSLTYVFLSAQEESAYINHFYEVTEEIVQVSQLRARGILDNLEALSTFTTSHALSANLTWPLVVVPDFQVHALLSNEVTGAATVTLYPMVPKGKRLAWEEFSQRASYKWMAESHGYDKRVDPSLYTSPSSGSPAFSSDPSKAASLWNETGITPHIWSFVGGAGNEARVPAPEAGMYFPKWQTAPASKFDPFTNVDMLTHPVFEMPIKGMLENDRPVLTEVTDAMFLLTKLDDGWFPPEELTEPHSYLLQPVYNSLEVGREAVAFLAAFVRWGTFFDQVLPEYETGVMVVLTGSCGQQFSYMMNGYKAEFLGKGDLHSREYDNVYHDFTLVPSATSEGEPDNKYCRYSCRIYPSKAWKDRYFTKKPYTYSLAVLSCFIVTTIVFAIYNCSVRRRQDVVMDSATRSNAIVSNLFPATFKDKLMEEVIKQDTETTSGNEPGWSRSSDSSANSNGIERGRRRGSVCLTSDRIFGSDPLAEQYPESTIMFADMAGFTAWSSEREPRQVFVLLETIYHAFDQLAKRRGVFKIETIGDCYVCCCGLPQPNKQHAVVMAKFATDCLNKMRELVCPLETVLGPGTAALSLRVGLHSGPVTAGVLRGDKGRFQLFGDSMNYASRMESTGEKGRIQVSTETAALLVAAGKDWTRPRENKVIAKGKGELQTYWLEIAAGSDTSHTEGGSRGDEVAAATPPIEESPSHPKPIAPATGTELATGRDVLSAKHRRLVKWNVDMLQKRLVAIVNERANRASGREKPEDETSQPAYSCPLDEMKDELDFPRLETFPAEQSDLVQQCTSLSAPVFDQLTHFVSQVARNYEIHEFHSFEHCSHTCMSVVKLLARLQSPNEGSCSELVRLVSHPVTQFSCLLAALVKDMAHSGLPNSVLVRNRDPTAIKYHNKSVAEQHSFDVAWELLMQPEYDELRSCIGSNREELSTFRSLLLQLVLATDVMDIDMGAQMDARWERAFGIDARTNDTATTNLKATVLLEHLMRATDVCHGMQHWHVFAKFDERLFFELYHAYLDGKLEEDPSIEWYTAELSFFDDCVIPLAQKLHSCGVFGACSSEYMAYAVANRAEWAKKGEDMVKEYLAHFAISH